MLGQESMTANLVDRRKHDGARRAVGFNCIYFYARVLIGRVVEVGAWIGTFIWDVNVPDSDELEVGVEGLLY